MQANGKKLLGGAEMSHGNSTLLEESYSYGINFYKH
jgi:hypothetical protein